MYFYAENNVRSTLTSAIASGDTTITVDPPVAPYKFLPFPRSDIYARFTIVDNVFEPTKIEVIEAKTTADGGGGKVILGSVTRGLEGTSAQSWDVGAVIYQAVTSEMLKGGKEGMYEYVDPSLPQDAWDMPHKCFVKAQSDTLIDRLTNDVILDVHADFLYSRGSIQADAGINAFNITATNRIESRVYSKLKNIKIDGTAPVSSSSPVPEAGQIRVDTDYIYISVGMNNWKRVALSAF